MTRQDALKWLQSEVGKKRDYDGAYGDQCVDEFNFYFRFLTGKDVYATLGGVVGAKDLRTKPLNKYGFKWVANNPNDSNQLPSPAAILIYGAPYGRGTLNGKMYYYGHVDMVESANKSGIHCIGQNEHGNPYEGVVRVYRTWGQLLPGLLGWWEFNGFTQGGDIMDLQAAQDLAEMAAGRNPNDAKNIADLKKNHVGKSALNDIKVWYASKERANCLKNRAEVLTTLRDDNATLKIEVANLKSQLSGTQKALDNTAKENKKLQASIASTNRDTNQLNALGQLLKWFIARLGLK